MVSHDMASTRSAPSARKRVGIAAYWPTIRPSCSATRTHPRPAGLSRNCQRHTSGRRRTMSSAPKVASRRARMPAASEGVKSRVTHSRRVVRALGWPSGRAGMGGERAEGGRLDAAPGERLGEGRVEEQLPVAVPAVAPVAVLPLGLGVAVTGMQHDLHELHAAGAEVVEPGEQAGGREPPARLEEADGHEGAYRVPVRGRDAPPGERGDAVHGDARRAADDGARTAGGPGEPRPHEADAVSSRELHDAREELRQQVEVLMAVAVRGTD